MVEEARCIASRWPCRVWVLRASAAKPQGSSFDTWEAVQHPAWPCWRCYVSGGGPALAKQPFSRRRGVCSPLRHGGAWPLATGHASGRPTRSVASARVAQIARDQARIYMRRADSYGLLWDMLKICQKSTKNRRNLGGRVGVSGAAGKSAGRKRKNYINKRRTSRPRPAWGCEALFLHLFV